MKIIEVNIWINPGPRYNGRLNINRGEYQTTIPSFVSAEKFVKQAIKRDPDSIDFWSNWIATASTKELYAWVGCDQDFVIWNPGTDKIILCIGSDLIEIPQNRTYQKQKKSMPDISFRRQVL